MVVGDLLGVRAPARPTQPEDQATFLSNEPGDVHYGTTGKPVPGYDLKIVDEDGREVADGEIGELVVRGPTAGEGY